MFNLKALAAALLGIVLSTTSAHASDVFVHHAWARASAGMAGAGAAFMAIHNVGAGADKLVAAKADVSAKVELHNHIMDGGIMKMRQVNAIPLPADSEVELKPGSYHIMFIGLKKPFVEGETFPLTLVLEKAGNVSVTVEVMGVAEMGNMGHDHSMQGHSGDDHMKHMKMMKEGKDPMKHDGMMQQD